MTIRNLKIDSLNLDLLNPRIRKASGQHDAMQQIIRDQGIKLVNLAESIVENGLNPMDRMIVLRDHGRAYIVLEGNRRTLALKLLSKPAILGGLEIAPTLRKRIETLSANFDRGAVEPVSCYQVDTREEGVTWIEQRHRGEDEGRGIVGWSAESVSRFTGSNPALQALDFVRQHPDLTDGERKTLSGKFPALSTLDRLLSTPSVRSEIGIQIVDRKLVTTLPVGEVIKPLKRIVLDLATKAINVSQLTTVAAQMEYVNGFPQENKADMSTCAEVASPLVDVETSRTDSPSDISEPSEKAGPKKNPRPRKSQRRTTLVPNTCQLNVTNNNTRDIYDELCKLQIKRFPNAAAVLLRVFVENSVDHYLEQNGIALRVKPPGGNREVNKTLDSKATEAIDHMISDGADKRHFDGVRRAIKDKNHPLSIDLQHAYVHNRFVTPLERDLFVAWDNAQVFFEKIWR